MKKLLIALMLIPTLSFAEGMIVDPNVYSSLTVNCTAPDQRIDETLLPATEIASYNFRISSDKVIWAEAGSDTVACRQIYSIADWVDGQYYISGSVTDTDAQNSILAFDANEYVALQILRAPLIPSAPTNITVTQR